jgi:hypothetical protein
VTTSAITTCGQSRRLAVAALVALGHVRPAFPWRQPSWRNAGRGVDLEIGASQIVEQHVELDVDQIAPAGDQMAEQVRFVFQQKIMTGIEVVRLGQAKIRFPGGRRGTAAEPVTVQFRLAARGDEPAGHQDLILPRILAVRRQAVGPKPI